MNTSFTSLGVLGVDFGGTVRQDNGIEEGSENSILNPDPRATGYLNSKPFRGARQSLERLRPYFSRVICVSRVDTTGPLVHTRLRRWYRVKRFRMLGPRDIFLCLKRHQKAVICKVEGVTYFIDNRVQVLYHLVDIVPNLYLFNPALGGNIEVSSTILSGADVVIVPSWRAFEWHVLHSAGLC
jgi:hypothetical protein